MSATQPPLDQVSREALLLALSYLISFPFFFMLIYGSHIKVTILTYRIPAGPTGQEEAETSNQGIYTIRNVQIQHQHRFWCVGKCVLVNPPLGKRLITDMTYMDLIVNREFFLCAICNVTITLFLPTSLYPMGS